MIPRAFAQIGLYRTLVGLFVLSASCTYSLSLTNTKGIAIGLFVLWLVTNSLIVVSLDTLLEDYSENESVGSIRGAYLTTVNIAWVFSPLISGAITRTIGYSGIYALGAFLVCVALAIVVIRFRTFRDPIYTTPSALVAVKDVFKNKNLLLIFAANFLLQAFYVVMVIYMPLYLHETLGYSWSTIGWVFAIMLTPFVLFQFPLGKLADAIGEKKILYVGFAIIAVATIVSGVLGITLPLAWAAVLFATRAGASSIEVMTESYFFKHVSGANPSIISAFRTLSPLAYIIIPALISVCAFTAVPSTLFLVTGICLLLGFLIIAKLKDNKAPLHEKK
jgi:MFS family permease